MKPKKVSKKLMLNKSTVADLRHEDMDAVKGGTNATGWCSDKHSECDGVSLCGSVYPCNSYDYCN